MSYICDLPNNISETATKENLQTYQRKSKYGRKYVLMFRCFYFTHFTKLFISLVVTNSHLYFFAFIWNMKLMCIPIYNLESYEYF